MEEAQFARELAKYKVIKRPEHTGPLQKKRTVQSSTTSTKSSKAAIAATAGNKHTSAQSQPKPDASFWDLLLGYASERMPEADAVKLVNTCKDLHNAEGSAKAEAVGSE